ncbi:YggT family protein [Pasteurellaceae bacterium LIM206]|nr:YggT family protein [Pasteurellaceae bacterium LIM206]
MTSLNYLASVVIGLYMFILMLRMWLQYCGVDFYNPISQTVVKLTNPVLNPLRKVIPTVKNIDLAALLFVFVLGTVKLPILSIISGEWSSELISNNALIYIVIGLLSVVRTFGEMLIYIIFIGAIMSWFNRGNDPVSYMLYQLGEPVLSPVRKILPRTGMIDFSPMIVAFILFFANSLMYDIFGILWQAAS